MQPSPALGRVLLTMFTAQQREHIASYVRSTGDFNLDTERYRLESGQPLSPMLAILNVGGAFTPEEVMDLITGLSVIYAHALTTDLSREQLAAIIQARGVPANYAMRLASEVDTEDSASIAMGIRALSRGVGRGSIVPSALLPFITTAVAGIAGLVGGSENQQSRDTLVECWRLGSALRRVSKESQLNAIEVFQELSNAPSLTLAGPTGVPTFAEDASGMVGAVGSGNLQTMVGSAFDTFVNAISRLTDGSESGEPGLSDADSLEDEDLEDIELPSVMADTAATAIAVREPGTTSLVTGRDAPEARSARKQQSKRGLKGIVKKLLPVATKAMRSSVDPSVHVRKAMKNLRERGEPADHIVQIARELQDMAHGGRR